MVAPSLGPPTGPPAPLTPAGPPGEASGMPPGGAAPPAAPEQVIGQLAAMLQRSPADIANGLAQAAGDLGVRVPDLLTFPVPNLAAMLGVLFGGGAVGAGGPPADAAAPPGPAPGLLPGVGGPPPGGPPPGLDQPPTGPPAPLMPGAGAPAADLPAPLAIRPGTAGHAYLSQPQPAEPPEPKPAEPPPPWRPPKIATLARRYQWAQKPKYVEVVQDAKAALDLYRERNDAAVEQENTYYLARMWQVIEAKAGERSPLSGDVVYTLTDPRVRVDTLVNYVYPNLDDLKINVRQRSDLEEHRQAAQRVENWHRTQLWRNDASWFDEVSQSRMDADLLRKLLHLAAVHGTAGWCLEVDTTYGEDNDGECPYPWYPVPLTELFPLGDRTLRIQTMRMAEARSRFRAVRQRYPRRVDDKGATTPGYVPDDWWFYVYSWCDQRGLWYARVGDVAGKYGYLESRSAAELPAADELWLSDAGNGPERLDYGFCKFQLPPGFQANGLPPSEDSRDDYGKYQALGVLHANVDTYRRMSQFASGMLSNALYNFDPGWVDKLMAQRRGGPPDPLKAEQHTPNYRYTDEAVEFLYKNASQSGNDFSLMLGFFGEAMSSDRSPSSGREQAASGYDRRLQQRQRDAVYADALERWMERTLGSIMRRSAVLGYRKASSAAYAGSGGTLYDELPFHSTVPNQRGYQVLTKKDFEQAGNDVVVTYEREDLDREIARNNAYVPRLDHDILSRRTVMELTDVADPEAEEDRIADDKALQHPAVGEARIELGLARRRSPMYPFFKEALDADRTKATRPGENRPGLSGAPSTAPTPAGGPALPPPAAPPPPNQPAPGMQP
jgi:hypothetical protein